MDTDKLVKAIQIIVAEEIKVVLPKLVKEGVKREMAKLLKENKQLREAIKKPKVTKKRPQYDRALSKKKRVFGKKSSWKKNKIKPTNIKNDPNKAQIRIKKEAWILR